MQKTMAKDRDFIVRIPARFLKDPCISSDAKALFAVIKSFADGKTGLTFVRPKKINQILHWGRGRREKIQRELCDEGWLQVGWKRGLGKWARRVYQISEPYTVARFQRSGDSGQLISYHSQSQVRSSITTSLSEQKIPKKPTFFEGDLT